MFQSEQLVGSKTPPQHMFEAFEIRVFHGPVRIAKMFVKVKDYLGKGIALLMSVIEH